MFYQKINSNVITLIEGFDSANNKVLKSCVVTDGEVNKIDDDYSLIEPSSEEMAISTNLKTLM